MSWQPMSTAPKDGPVLLSVPRRAWLDGKPFTGIGWWAGGCWFLMYDYCGDPRTEPADPDGWQPIPAPVSSVPMAITMPDLTSLPHPISEMERLQERQALERMVARRAEIEAAVAAAVEKRLAALDEGAGEAPKPDAATLGVMPGGQLGA